MVGDSLTDGRGSTANANDRWPDLLLDRLHADHWTADVAIVNQGVGGNRLLTDGLGTDGLYRIERDVLRLSGVAWFLVFEGTNDIGTAAATGPEQTRVADDLLAAYEQIVVRAHDRDVLVYSAARRLATATTTNPTVVAKPRGKGSTPGSVPAVG